MRKIPWSVWWEKIKSIRPNWRAIWPWLVASALGWRDYILTLPDKARRLTRWELRVRAARFIFALAIVYLVAGIFVGAGYYVPVRWCQKEGGVKVCPWRMESSFARLWSKLYPYPAEVVGWQLISLRDVTKQEKIIYYFADSSGTPVPDRFEVDKKVMESLDEVGLAQKGLKDYRTKVTRQDIDAVLKTIEDENGGKDQVRDLLQSLYGLTPSGFREVVRDQLVKDKISSDILKTLKVRHILVADEAQARSVKEKIEKGEISFEDAAKQYSTDQGSKDNGGLVKASESSEFVGRDSGLVQEFIDAAYALPVGTISDPVKTEFGYHLIRVDETRGQVDQTYANFLQGVKDKTIIWRLWRR